MVGSITAADPSLFASSWPRSTTKGLKKPGSEADDVTPKEAGGFACFQKIQNCCEEHGIAMFRTSENGEDESVLDENGQVRRKALVLVGGDLRILRRSVVVVLLA